MSTPVEPAAYGLQVLLRQSLGKCFRMSAALPAGASSSNSSSDCNSPASYGTRRGCRSCSGDMFPGPATAPRRRGATGTPAASSAARRVRGPAVRAGIGAAPVQLQPVRCLAHAALVPAGVHEILRQFQRMGHSACRFPLRCCRLAPSMWEAGFGQRCAAPAGSESACGCRSRGAVRARGP